jgi:hypothetical protein
MMTGSPERRRRVADWLEIFKQQTETGNRMAQEVPKVLADPNVTAEQVKALFQALEKQAEFVERLTAALEKFGYDFDIVDAAGTLEERYAELAAAAAEKLKEMRG